jgi:hypothetical protein
MEKGSGDHKKLINDGNRNSYSESNEGGDVATLQRDALALG